MKIAFVSSEVFPYAKTGGLADVAGSLPIELSKLGHEVKVFMPNYKSIDHNKYFINRIEIIPDFPVRVGGWDRDVKLYNSFLPNSNVEIIFIDHPYYFHRNKIYTENWDEDERFIFFQKGFIETLQRLQWKPDVVTCNDWQTGLIPLLVKDNYNWDSFFDKKISRIISDATCASYIDNIIPNKKYVCISTSSTAGLKHWQNETGWQEVVNHLNDLGYEVVLVQP